MAVQDNVQSCAEAVRVADYDRYLSVLFAPREKRAALMALYAFNFEVAKTAETVSEAPLGLIRLQWWREAIEGIYDAQPRRHEVVTALGDAVQAYDLPRILFDGLIDARERDLLSEPFPALYDLENYADATSGHLMRLGVRILGGGNRFDGTARALGIAYALTGLMRAFPHLAAQRRIMLPLSMIKDAGIKEEDIYAGRADNIRTLMDNCIAQVERHLAAASEKIPRGILPAILPAALIRPYVRIIAGRNFNPFRNPVSLSVPRKQIAMLGAILRGRV